MDRSRQVQLASLAAGAHAEEPTEAKEKRRSESLATLRDLQLGALAGTASAQQQMAAAAAFQNLWAQYQQTSWQQMPAHTVLQQQQQPY